MATPNAHPVCRFPVPKLEDLPADIREQIEAVRAVCGPDFALMVPGIRPAGSAAGDQKRIMTPKDALDKGATHLVIGRPITQADDPLQAARDILATL